jgi:transcriptional regulator with XRE-family HTH domain
MMIDFGPDGNYIGHLKTRLAAANLTQADLARTARIAPSQITRWFTRNMQPQVNNIVALEEAMRMLAPAKAKKGAK